MSVNLAASILAGQFFLGFMFAIYLYVDGKKLTISIVDRK